MFVSTFELFKIGIGPSSSHTVGPMRAARRFIERCDEAEVLNRITRIRITLYGSLAHTGRGHGTDHAIILGLEGYQPDQVNIDLIPKIIERVTSSKNLYLNKNVSIPFCFKTDIRFEKRRKLQLHSNGMLFTAFDQSDALLHERTYFSVGGGFIVNHMGEAIEEVSTQANQSPNQTEIEIAPGHEVLASNVLSAVAQGWSPSTQLPYEFSSADHLLKCCEESGLSISALMRANEECLRAPSEISHIIQTLWKTMCTAIDRGCRIEGILPGGLRVQRRAPTLYRKLKARITTQDPTQALDWVNLWAIAVNEENAAGGRVVTAPTNGAAGIIPAVLSYYHRFIEGADEEGTERFLLTSAAIGGLYKLNASISGAEVGCQGEVGVACSMAAAGLAEVMGGTPRQVENAAEIGMEHNLGLTCDPIGGLVQVPCIERNAMGAVKAINAARLALSGDGSHKVSLDKVIRTMRATGADMSTKYKETSRGGLALNIIEC